MRVPTKVLFGLSIGIAVSAPLQGQIIQAGSCQVDTELIELPSCAVETRNGQPYVIKGLLKTFFSQGTISVRPVRIGLRYLASGYTRELGWFYFNRNGRIIVRDVLGFDNGVGPFNHGLVIVSRSQKAGLANVNGKLVVPLEFDQILYFEEEDRWLACKGCKTERAGDYGVFLPGGEWYAIDRHGKLVGAVENPFHH
jgi:hypothetical protein